MSCSGDSRFVRKHVDADRTYGFDFGPQLADGQTLDGTPTVTVEPSGELTFSGEQVNGTVFTDPEGKTIAVGGGVLMQLSGGVAGTSYEVAIECDIAGGADDVAETFVVSVYDD